MSHWGKCRQMSEKVECCISFCLLGNYRSLNKCQHIKITSARWLTNSTSYVTKSQTKQNSRVTSGMWEMNWWDLKFSALMSRWLLNDSGEQYGCTEEGTDSKQHMVWTREWTRWYIASSYSQSSLLLWQYWSQQLRFPCCRGRNAEHSQSPSKEL